MGNFAHKVGNSQIVNQHASVEGLQALRDLPHDNLCTAYLCDRYESENVNSVNTDQKLSHDGRSGLFISTGEDLSVQVAGDTLSAVYVAPSFDPSGASGGWVRDVHDCTLNITQFGLTVDGSAVEQTEWQTASDFCERNHYRLQICRPNFVTLNDTWNLNDYSAFELISSTEVPHFHNVVSSSQLFWDETTDVNKHLVTSFRARNLRVRGIGFKNRTANIVPAWQFSDPNDRVNQNQGHFFEGCTFEGRSNQELRLFFETSQMSRTKWDNCKFRRVKHAIGRDFDFFNYQILITGCRFSQTTGVPIWNSSGGYTVQDSTFLSLRGGAPGAVGGPLAVIQGDWKNNYLGDVNKPGIWYDAIFNGAVVSGHNPIAGSSNGSAIVGINVRIGSTSLKVEGNRFSGVDLIPINWEDSAVKAITDFHHNFFAPVREPAIKATLAGIPLTPTGAIAQRQEF